MIKISENNQESLNVKMTSIQKVSGICHGKFTQLWNQ